MNINASNHSLDNVFIQQKTEKKRPSFASVFEKLNKRVEKMNRKTPLNNVLTNEQLFRYYVKEVEPLLKKSNDDFGEGNISLGDIMRNLKSNMKEAGGTDGGNPPEEPPVDENVPLPKFFNRFSALEEDEGEGEGEDEAGAPFKDANEMSQILENSYTSNADDDGEASFNADYVKERDGSVIYSKDGKTFLKIKRKKTKPVIGVAKTDEDIKKMFPKSFAKAKENELMLNPEFVTMRRGGDVPKTKPNKEEKKFKISEEDIQEMDNIFRSDISTMDEEMEAMFRKLNKTI